MNEGGSLFPALKGEGSWAEQLAFVGNQLMESGIIKERNDIGRGIADWQKHPDHGAHHSQMIYQGAAYLAKKEGVVLDAPADRQLQLLSVVHDIPRFFDGIDLSGEPIVDYETTRYKKHAQRAAFLILELGRYLGFSQTDITRLSNDFYNHDLGYSTKMDEKQWHRRVEKMDAVGRIFHDADKLFVHDLSTDPVTMAKNALERNLTGGAGAEGWYFLRPDLSDKQRNEFEYGDRWHMDQAATMRLEFHRLRMATESGRQLFAARSRGLDQAIPEVYGPKFDEAAQVIKDWEANPGPVTLVGKNYPPVEYNAHQLKGGLPTLITVALNAIVKVKYPEETMKIPKGIKLKINDQVIDPTIGRFVYLNNGREQFLAATMKAIRGGIKL